MTPEQYLYSQDCDHVDGGFVCRRCALMAIAVAIAEEREALAKLSDERAAEHGRKRSAYPDEESWWRARMCEARDYAATIRARP